MTDEKQTNEPGARRAATINEMTERVTEGLIRGIDIVKDDDQLLMVLKSLSYTYDKLCGDLIVVACGISAMRTQHPDDVRKFLTNMHVNLTAKQAGLRRLNVDDFIGRS
jgi:hypothetical protein